MQRPLLCYIYVVILFFYVAGCSDRSSNTNNNLNMTEEVYQEKLQNVKKMLKRDPKNAKAHNYLGILYEKKQMHDWAIHEFKEAIQLDSKYCDAIVNLANVYLLTNEKAKAEDYLRQTIQLDDTYIAAKMYLAILMKEKNKLDESLSLYQSVLKIEPRNISALNSAGVIYFEIKNYEESKKCFLDVVKLDPDYGDAYYNLAVLSHYHEHELQQAKKYYIKYLAIDPDGEYTELVKNLLLSLEKDIQKQADEEARNKEAVEALSAKRLQLMELEKAWIDKNYSQVKLLSQTILKADIHNISAREKSAKALFELKEYSEALKEYQTILQMFPDQTRFYFDMAQICDYQLNIPENALEYYALYLKAYPSGDFNVSAQNRIDELVPQGPSKTTQNATVTDTTSTAKTQSGIDVRTTNSTSVLVNASKSKKEDKKTVVPVSQEKKVERKAITSSAASKTSSNFFNEGLKYQSKGNYSMAIASYIEAIKQNPQNALAYFNLGVVYAMSGNKQESVKAYENAVKYDRRNVKAYYNKGLLYKELGKNDLALNSFNSTIKIDSKFADAYMAMGLIYDQQKNKKLAEQYFKKYLSLKPNGAHASKLKAWLTANKA